MIKRKSVSRGGWLLQPGAIPVKISFHLQNFYYRYHYLETYLNIPIFLSVSFSLSVCLSIFLFRWNQFSLKDYHINYLETYLYIYFLLSVSFSLSVVLSLFLYFLSRFHLQNFYYYSNYLETNFKEFFFLSLYFFSRWIQFSLTELILSFPLCLSFCLSIYASPCLFCRCVTVSRWLSPSVSLSISL